MYVRMLSDKHGTNSNVTRKQRIHVINIKKKSTFEYFEYLFLKVSTLS